MARSQPTIIDIAEELGISKSTVSAALTGRGRVSERTRESVANAAARLGYVGNRAARSLRSSTLGAIGLYVPPAVRNFSFYMEFAFGAAHTAARLDVDLTLFARDPGISARRGFHVDGAIVVDPLPDDPMLSHLLDAGIPIVTAGREVGTGTRRTAGCIEVHHADLTRQVLDLLWDNGSRRPAFLEPNEHFHSAWAEDLSTTYIAWCHSRDIEPAHTPISVTADDAALSAAVSALVAQIGVDALICGPQGFAGRSLSTLKDLGYQAGLNFPVVSLIGDPVTERDNPAITSIAIDPWQFGCNAAAFLADLIDTPSDSTVARSQDATIQTAPYLTT
ncbi:LacI family DNA-binding transcriptional regulator [Rhodococcus qingshengii]|uniref:LacI family DNA-binding transcriptional regulator n=1 Tax=Rhodococcus qingshengii TaxID=334542 RepID=UPI0007E540E0|nr:LacI family DNA-binding transcriptional regulator [Rhodococcus qingshengii]